MVTSVSRGMAVMPSLLASVAAPIEGSVGTCIERACAHLTSPTPLRTYCALSYRRKAQVAELVDALVSGTSAARRGGSSPLLGTIHFLTPCSVAFNSAGARTGPKVRAFFVPLACRLQQFCGLSCE